MKNKGFTLVELLAVIAILALLVIVAMPNVLGMFNQAKVNSFITEVQKIMDTATTAFTNDALLNRGKTVYYSSESNAILKTKELDMSGNKKNYFIEMDRNGEFKRVLVYDNNYCYDVYTTVGSEHKFIMGSSNPIKIMDNYEEKKIDKTFVLSKDVWEAGNDNINISIVDDRYRVSGCESVVTVDGNILQTDKVKIEGSEYSYVPGMTWKDWTESDYNTNGYVLCESQVSSDSICASNGAMNIYYYNPFYYSSEDAYRGLDEVRGKQQIIKGENYQLKDVLETVLFLHYAIEWAEWDFDYYDYDKGIKYNMELKTYRF